MKKINLFLVSILFPFFLSCESELEYKGLDNIDPKLVLNTLLFANNDTCRLYITESRSVFRKVWDKENGWYESRFPHIKDAEVNFSVNERLQMLSYHDIDSSFLFLENLKAGDKIDVEVSHKDRLIKASAFIPSAPKVISVDTVTIPQIKNDYMINWLRYRVTFKDAPGARNFYRLYYERRFYHQVEYWGEDNSYWESSNGFYTDDPVLTNGYTEPIEDADIEIGSYPKNDLGIFTDKLIDGQTYTLTFYVPPVYNEEFIEKGSVRVSLQSISEDLYKYYYSIQKSIANDESTTEPVMIYNNIHNGLGIIGAINETEVYRKEYGLVAE